MNKLYIYLSTFRGSPVKTESGGEAVHLFDVAADAVDFVVVLFVAVNVFDVVVFVAALFSFLLLLLQIHCSLFFA